MSTIKISELNFIQTLNPNTALTILPVVDTSTGITFKSTATTLAQGLYAHNILNVGNNSVIFPNTIAQFAGNSVTYLQINAQNFVNTGSVDMILTADTGTNANSYIDLGINNSGFSDPNFRSMNPYDGYLYVQGPFVNSNPSAHINPASGNLVIGTASANANINFIVGGTDSNNIFLSINGADQYQIADFLLPVAINVNTGNYWDQNGDAFTITNSGNGNSIVVDTGTNPVVVDTDGNISIGDYQSYNYLLYVAGDSWINGNVVANGIVFPDNTVQTTAFSNSWIKSTFLANTNTITVAKNLVVPGNMTIYGTETRYGNIIAYGTQTWNGNTITNGNTVVNGVLVNNGNTYNNGTTFNNGITYLAGQLLPNTTGISIGSPSQPFDNIYTSNSNIVFANANVAISGTLTANGPITFNGNSTLNGLVTVSNTLAVNNVFVVNVPNDSLYCNGIMTIACTTFSATNSAVRIDGSNNGIALPTTSTGTMLQIIGFDGPYATRVLIDDYNSGSATSYPLLAGRAARGNSANPSSIQSGDVLFRIGGQGYGNTFTLLGGASVDLIASENYTDATKGSQINLTTTPVGTNNRTTTLSVNSAAVVVNTNAQLIANNISATSITIQGNSVPTMSSGTWTPNVIFSTSQGSQGYTVQAGYWTKVDKGVRATFNLTANGTQTGTGNVSISLVGLPATLNVANVVAGSVLVSQVGGSVSSVMISPQGSIQPGANSVPIYSSIYVPGGGGAVTYRQINNTDLGTTFQISGMIEYISNS